MCVTLCRKRRGKLVHSMWCSQYVEPVVQPAPVIVIDPNRVFRDGRQYPANWEKLSGATKRLLMSQHKAAQPSSGAESLEDVEQWLRRGVR